MDPDPIVTPSGSGAATLPHFPPTNDEMWANAWWQAPFFIGAPARPGGGGCGLDGPATAYQSSCGGGGWVGPGQRERLSPFNWLRSRAPTPAWVGRRPAGWRGAPLEDALRCLASPVGLDRYVWPKPLVAIRARWRPANKQRPGWVFVPYPARIEGAGRGTPSRYIGFFSFLLKSPYAIPQTWITKLMDRALGAGSFLTAAVRGRNAFDRVPRVSPGAAWAR